MKFSIIVPTYNEEKDILPTLEALVALDYPDYEVFMVDDSTDSTPQIVEKFACQGIQLIRPGGGGRCEARNKGIRLATGDVIVVLNADVQLPRDFLNRIKVHYDNGVDLLCVKSRAANDDDLFARYVDCQYLLKENNPPCDEWPLWTEGFSCRRELALEAGLFPDGFPVAMYAGEDVVFAEKLIECGGKKVFDKSIVVEHIAPASFEEYWRIRKSRGQACSQYRRYISRWSFFKIAGWMFLKTAYNVVKFVSVFFPLIYCWRLSGYSKVGRRDWLSLYMAWMIECIAMTWGWWEELNTIRKKEAELKFRSDAV